MTQGTALAFRRFTYERNHRRIFNGLDLSVKRGEIHAVISSSSYDLDNLYTLATGLLDYSGPVLLDERETKYSALKKNCYAVALDTSLFYEFSIPQNIFIYSNISQRSAARKTAELFRKLSIHIDPQTPVRQLTGSQRKLIEIVRGYQKRPSVLVLNEVLYHVDRDMQSGVISLVRRIAGEGTGVLFLTSKLEDAVAISDRITLLENGTALGSYSTSHVKKSPKHLMQLMMGLDAESLEDQEIIEVLNAIVSAREDIESTAKLRLKLEEYANRIITLMQADLCVIFMREANGKGVAIRRPAGSEPPPAVMETFLRTPETLQIIGDAWEAFPGAELRGTWVYVPIQSREQNCGYALVGFEDVRKVLKRDELLLQAFIKDILISVESSRSKTRSMLLQESNHRIKNNLQTITALLYMQKQSVGRGTEGVSAAEFHALMNDSISRIKSIALIHETLTLHEEQSDSIVDIKTIIERILDFYRDLHLSVSVVADPIAIPYDKATLIALVINELLNNCAKHAFPCPEAEENQVSVSCRDRRGMLEIVVRDNGRGFGQSPPAEGQGSCGMQVIRLVTTNLGGTITYQSDHGAAATVRIPKENLFEDTETPHM